MTLLVLVMQNTAFFAFTNTFTFITKMLFFLWKHIHPVLYGKGSGPYNMPVGALHRVALLEIQLCYGKLVVATMWVIVLSSKHKDSGSCSLMEIETM